MNIVVIFQHLLTIWLLGGGEECSSRGSDNSGMSVCAFLCYEFYWGGGGGGGGGVSAQFVIHNFLT